MPSNVYTRICTVKTSRDWQAQRQQHKNAAHKHKPFCCAGLWSRKGNNLQAFFMRICAVPTPSVARKLNKIICLRLADWLAGIWVCLWLWWKFNLMRGTLPPHPPTTALLLIFFFFSPFLILPSLTSMFMGLSFYRVRVRLTEKRGPYSCRCQKCLHR